MSKLLPYRFRRRSLLTIILLSICFCLGWGLAQGIQPSAAESVIESREIGTVDPVLAGYQMGQKLYLENCATCHIAIPPAVLPSQTWFDLLQDPNHYGKQLPTINGFDLRLMWNYLGTYSRSLREDEQVPYRLTRARHFYALHPQVDLPRPVKVESCITCHPKANVFNFREWQATNLRSSAPASSF